MTELSDIFAIQDRTGTVAQLTLDAHPAETDIAVNDTGTYNGLNGQGVAVSYNFTVSQIIGPEDICITTRTPTGAPGNILQSGWPKSGTITWLTGGNVDLSPNETPVIARVAANAYCSTDFFAQYHNSRGNVFPDSPTSAIEQAIVTATDFLDQRYRFRGTKLLQFLSDNPAFDPSIGFIDPWLAQSGFFGGTGMGPGTNFVAWFTPSFTFQQTEWPRQGAVDDNGDSVFGVPEIVQKATCEAALRVLNGVKLQPDYDPTLIGAGGVVQSTSIEVGPIRKTNTYDTKLGLSFFPDIPQVTRMLSKGGLLVAGSRRVIR